MHIENTTILKKKKKPKNKNWLFHTPPVLDQPVVASLLGAVAHSQHAMIHMMAALAVSVNTCGAKKRE